MNENPIMSGECREQLCALKVVVLFVEMQSTHVVLVVHVFQRGRRRGDNMYVEWWHVEYRGKLVSISVVPTMWVLGSNSWACQQGPFTS